MTQNDDNDNKMNKKLNTILNESEQNLLLEHNYDGIEEFDYPLPAWWVWIFIGCSIFGVFYLYFYHFADGGSLKKEFLIENAKIEKIRDEAQRKMNSFSQKDYKAWLASNDGIALGKEVFMDNCAACHTETGGGDIGPNLTDSYWIHLTKVTPENVFKIVKDGVIDKGMPVWGESLSKEEIYAAVTYVVKVLHNSHVQGKAPQGKKIKE